MEHIDSFLYCWTDTITNKLYVGIHKGSIDDGYICSSKLMLEEYDKRKETFIRQIIAVGTYKDIGALEHAILKKEDAAKNEIYYNKSNGGKKFFHDCNHSEETKKKLSLYKREDLRQFNLSENNPSYKLENRKNAAKRGKKYIGKCNPMFGKKHSDAAKLAMSINSKGKNTQPKTIETKLKMSLARKLYWDKKKGLV